MASLETIKLEDESNYTLSEINKIKDYFNKEIQYQQILTNKLSKYLTIFDYSNKILTVDLTVFSGTNIFAHVKGKKKLLGLITVFSSLFSLSFEINIKLQQETKLRKKKHNRLLYLAKKKLACIELLISNSIKDGIINHDEFLEIVKEKKEYDSLKNEENVESVSFFLSVSINVVFIADEAYKNAVVDLIKDNEIDDFLGVKMKDVQN